MHLAGVARIPVALLMLALAARVAGGAARVRNGTLEVEAAVRRAGNAPDDAERLAILSGVLKRGDLPPAFRQQLEPFVKTIRDYVSSPSLTKYGRSRGFDHKIPADSPLYPLLCFYRARTLLWHMVESGGILGYGKRRDEYVRRSTRLLETARAAFPDNPVIGMYLGKPIPPEKQYAAPPGAPEWAVWQREALERLTDIIAWWVDHRQQPDGSYGGGLEDDCEMWRWWVPVLIAFQHPKIEAAQRRLSECILRRENMAKSYSSYLADVEHSAEWSADAITPMMHLAPDDPAWRTHALNLVRLARELWTGRNRRGFLQFKSTYFSSEKVRDDARGACDSVYHPRALQPALLYWLRTGDESVGQLVAAWMDTWVDAAARAERGKPAGIIPSAIHWPDGKVGGVGENWWEPKNYGTRLYDWPSAMPMMANTLLQTHHMTGQRKYLDPLHAMAAILRQHLADPPKGEPTPGTAAWCAVNMGFLPRTLAKCRFLTGDKQFDDLLLRRASAYARFRLKGDLDGLTRSLKGCVDALRINFPGYTREVRWTDRVISLPGNWFRHAGHDVPRPDPGLVYSSATGDPGGVGYFPMNAVRWLTPPRDIAALVVDNGPAHLTARLFSFGDALRPLAAELYLLQKGAYRLTLTPTSGPVLDKPIRVAGPRTRIQFALPPRMLCTLKIARTATP